MNILTITQFRVRPKVTSTSAFRYRALNVSGKPLAGVVQMQNVFAAETKRRKLTSHLRLALFFWLVGTRDAHNLETDYTTREVSTAVGTTHTRIDARCEKWISRLESRCCLRRRGTSKMRRLVGIVRE